MTETKLRVLVVDDDHAVREALKFALELEGMDVRTHASGPDLLRRAPAADCLVLDYRMPGMDGLAVMAALAARRVEIPVIMITAPLTPAVAGAARMAGVFNILEKPLAGDVLLDNILAAAPPVMPPSGLAAARREPGS